MHVWVFLEMHLFVVRTLLSFNGQLRCVLVYSDSLVREKICCLKPEIEPALLNANYDTIQPEFGIISLNK